MSFFNKQEIEEMKREQEQFKSAHPEANVGDLVRNADRLMREKEKTALCPECQGGTCGYHGTFLYDQD